MKLNFWFFVDSVKYGVERLWLNFQNVGQHIVGFALKIKEAVKLAWEGNFGAARDKMKEEIVTTADKQLEALNQARKKQVDAWKRQTVDNAKKVVELSKGISIKWKKGDNKETEEEPGGLLAPLVGSNGSGSGGGDGSLGDVAGGQINGVNEKASGPRSITINIEAFNKGGINTSNTTLSKMNAEEIEQWFTEMGLRMVRAIEISHG